MKKLQVFISSTYEDLVEERQIAVESVLNAGHIPAGMELFKSGDTSQKDAIKKWIEESDVYMLILGGRYGSIDPETELSYTHWEYKYAEEIGKPRFAVVISNEYLDTRVQEVGISVLERKNVQKYEGFKKDVLSKISKFYSDLKDIKIAVLESLKEYEKDEKLSGWVAGYEIDKYQKIETSYMQLLEESKKLQIENNNLKEKNRKKQEISEVPYDDIKKTLKKSIITLPEELAGPKETARRERSLHNLFINTQDSFAIGVTNNLGMSDYEKLLFFQLAPKLMSFGLVEKVKLSGTTAQRIQTSKDGLKYLKFAELEKAMKSDDK